MKRFNNFKEAILHLAFPHVCDGCGSSILPHDSRLCLRCIDSLPRTWFELLPANPVEKKFYGRIPILSAMAQYYFTKSSLIAHLVHELKYRGNKDLGIQLGRLMGDSIRQSNRFCVDAMIPLPLFLNRQKKRGYNQSMVLCEGMDEALRIPILDGIIHRPMHTETQTKKGRVERWQNVEGKFTLQDPERIAGKHILLVDDVITTGATLESCGMSLLMAPGVTLSIACLCHAFS